MSATFSSWSAHAHGIAWLGCSLAASSPALAIGLVNHGADSLGSSGIERTNGESLTSASLLGFGALKPGNQVTDLTARLRRTWLELSVLRVDTVSLYDLEAHILTSTSGLELIVLPPTFPIGFYVKPSLHMTQDRAEDSRITLGSFVDTVDGSHWTLELTSSVPLLPAEEPWSTVAVGHDFRLTKSLSFVSEWHIGQLASGVDYGARMATALSVDSLLDW